MKDYVESFMNSYEKQRLRGVSIPILDSAFNEEKSEVREAVVLRLITNGFNVEMDNSLGPITVKLSKQEKVK